jgi:hypothetical protein
MFLQKQTEAVLRSLLGRRNMHPLTLFRILLAITSVRLLQTPSPILGNFVGSADVLVAVQLTGGRVHGLFWCATEWKKVSRSLPIVCALSLPAKATKQQSPVSDRLFRALDYPVVVRLIFLL